MGKDMSLTKIDGWRRATYIRNRKGILYHKYAYLAKKERRDGTYVWLDDSQP